MINLVLGEQGVGKTKYLVEEANKEKEKGNNNNYETSKMQHRVLTILCHKRII